MEKEKKEREFELADKNEKILNSQKCDSCQFVLYQAHECKENKCSSFCQRHLPQNGKCPDCGGQLFYNQILTLKINEKFKIICLNCQDVMMLKDYQSHLLKDECLSREDCIQKEFEILKQQNELLKIEFKKQNEEILLLKLEIENLKQNRSTKRENVNFFF